MKHKPADFWKFVSERRKSNSIPKRIQLDSQVAETDIQKANLFARHFKSKYNNRGKEFNFNSFIDQLDSNNQPQMHITLSEIQAAITQMDTKKGKGFDRLPPQIVQRCNDELSIPLYFIFNKSLELGEYPDIWKCSYVTPIHKSGTKTNAQNYRPISVGCTLAKIFDKILNSKLLKLIENEITQAQHGFVSHKNTTSNLFELIVNANNAFYDNAQLEVLATDFAGAFDSLRHDIAIQKIAKFNLNKNFIRWMWSYLTNRIQIVKINDSESEKYYALSGTPQGAALSSTIFIMFINDLPDRIKFATVSLFADDSKLSMKIKTLNDVFKFQMDCNNMNDWCEENDLQLNFKKCKSISLHRKHSPITRTFYLGMHAVERVDQYNDLGIIIDKRLTFDAQINFALQRAYARLGFVKRIARNKFSVGTTKTLYSALVRPIIEYASCVWCPNAVGKIARIESLQKQYLIFALRDTEHRDNDFRLRPYLDRCQTHNIQTLQRRRINAQIFYMYDVIKRNILTPAILNEIRFNSNALNLRNYRILSIINKKRQLNSSFHSHKSLITSIKYQQYIPTQRQKKIFNLQLKS